MRRPQGYLLRVEAGCADVERDTFTCGHCQRIVIVRPKADPVSLGGLCKQCMAMICPRCLGRGCTPWEKQMERMEARAEALRSYGTGG